MYDVIVIGAGAAGMTSALYSLRNSKTVLVLEQESLGGQIATSPRLENYPSIKQISGEEFADNLFNQITDLGADLEIDKVVNVEKLPDKTFKVTTEYGEYFSKSVIIAAGVKHKHLRTKSNREDLVGKGVYYCAICDGPFYKDQEVAVIGDANTALQYSLLLSSYCKKVYIYTLFDRFFGDKALIKTLLSKENIEWRPNTATTDFIGETEFKALEYKDKDGNIYTHELPAVFVAIGQVPDNKAFENLVDLDKEGYIISDETCKTKTEGLFVAGDCRTKSVRQVVTAVADGGVAATNASLYIESLDAKL
ncbi:MAG: FAD-dependent oxidoreductase [Clostridia bacterium]|nr:FAD-dependent oxidoreductase [Clostridia bacterium]